MSASDWLTDFKQGSGSGNGNGNNRQLPTGWEQGFDNKSGRIYYFNRLTQQSSWDVPSADMAGPASQASQQQPAQRSNQQPQREMPTQRNNMQSGGDMRQQRGGDMRGGDSMQQQQQQQQPANRYQSDRHQQSQHDSFDVRDTGKGQQRGFGGDDNRDDQWRAGGRSSDNQDRGGMRGQRPNRNDDDERWDAPQQRQKGDHEEWGKVSKGGSKGDDSGKGGKGGSKGDDWGKGSKGGSKGGGKGDSEEWAKGGRGNDDEDEWGHGKNGKGGKGKDRYGGKGGRDERKQETESTGVVSIARQGYDDNNLPSDKNFTWRLSNCEEFNLAENRITGQGLNWMLRPCNNFPHLRIVKMHKNGIGDAAAPALVKLCRNSPFLNELHLSHNQLTWTGADKIVPAACERQILKNIEGADPTLWLRLEQNQVEDAKGLFSDWQRRGLMVSLYHKSDTNTPHGVILPYFMSQRVPGGHAFRGDETEWDAKNWGEESWRGARAADAEWWAGDDSWSWKAQKGEQAYGWSESSKGKGKGGKGKGQQAVADWNSWSGGKGGEDWQTKDKKAKGEKAADKDGEAKPKKEKGGGKGSKGITDDSLEEFCKKHAEDHKDDKVLDIANNKLTGLGFSVFGDLCMELANLTIVKLHKNLLADSACSTLAKMCSECPKLSELHLSHNLITRIGAEEIVVAACEVRKAKKAKKDDDAEAEEEEEEQTRPPLWLRLEYNEIEEPQTLADDWKERELNVKVYSKGPSRHNLSKGVHLPYFLSQGKPSGYVHGESSVKKIKKDVEEEEEWEEQEWPEKAEKKEKQLKWKPKKVPSAEEAAADKKEEDATDDKKDEEDTDDKKQEEPTDAAAPTEAKASKKKSKRGPREAGEDDDGQERTVFSSEGESEGSDAN